MATRPSPTGNASRPSGFRRVLACDGLAVLTASAVTIAVELGVYAAAVLAGSGRAQAVLATLAVTVVWLALAAPALSASGADAIGALLRGGCIADASAVTLIVLWLSSPQVALPAAMRIYCILAAMALLAVALSCLARRAPGKSALAVATAGGFLIALASPWWVGGALRAAPQETAEKIVAAGVYINPFYAVTAAMSDSSRFVWHEAAAMYRITRIGDYAAAPRAVWWASAALHCAAGLVAAAVAAGVHRRRRNRAALERPPRPAPL